MTAPLRALPLGAHLLLTAGCPPSMVLLQQAAPVPGVSCIPDQSPPFCFAHAALGFGYGGGTR